MRALLLIASICAAVAQNDDQAAAVPAAPAASVPKDPLAGGTIDCGGWRYPDSHENTKQTIYGKVGYICTSDGLWGNQPLRGTGPTSSSVPITR